MDRQQRRGGRPHQVHTHLLHTHICKLRSRQSLSHEKKRREKEISLSLSLTFGTQQQLSKLCGIFPCKEKESYWPVFLFLHFLLPPSSWRSWRNFIITRGVGRQEDLVSGLRLFFFFFHFLFVVVVHAAAAAVVAALHPNDYTNFVPFWSKRTAKKAKARTNQAKEAA